MTCGRPRPRPRSAPRARAGGCCTPPAIRAVLDGVAAEVVPIGVLPRGAARQLLRRLTRVRGAAGRGRPDLRRRRAGWRWRSRWSARRSAAGGRSWAQAAEQLDRGGGHVPGSSRMPTPSRRCRSASPRWTRTDAQAYRSLAVYPEDTVVPVAAVRRLWSHLSGASAQDTAARLDRLAARSLLTVQRRRGQLPRPAAGVPAAAHRGSEPGARGPAGRLPCPAATRRR